ncbi:hypothetical protein BC828DRAFT_393499 [Blastocladiella britannica]|nr:hypothetical protein BC828DRAFT_393499 [Blastocladiella britannica]
MAVWTQQVVSGTLYFFLATSILLLYVNVREWHRRKAPTKSMFTILAVGSGVLVINQITFQVLSDGPADTVWGTCKLWQIAEPTTYMAVQLIFTACLIWRATAILKVNEAGPWYLSKKGIRILLFGIFAVAWTTVLVSIIMATVGVNVVTNRCIYVPLPSINSPGKIVYFILYTLIVLIFISTLQKHMRTMDSVHGSNHHSSTGAGGGSSTSNSNHTAAGHAMSPVGVETGSVSTKAAAAPSTFQKEQARQMQQPLRRLMHHMTGRIVLAVLVYLGTAIAAFANGFVGGNFVAFSLQLQSAVVACTMAMANSSSSNSSKKSAAASAATAGSSATQRSMAPVPTIAAGSSFSTASNPLTSKSGSGQ